MNDILIGAIIIIVCLFIFGLMAVLVVDSHKKALAKNKISDEDRIELIQAAAYLRHWSNVINDTDARAKAEMNPDPTLQDLKDQFNQLLADQQAAIDNEDYELAAKCRDTLENLKVQLKKIEDEDQTT